MEILNMPRHLIVWWCKTSFRKNDVLHLCTDNFSHCKESNFWIHIWIFLDDQAPVFYQSLIIWPSIWVRNWWRYHRMQSQWLLICTFSCFLLLRCNYVKTKIVVKREKRHNNKRLKLMSWIWNSISHILRVYQSLKCPLIHQSHWKTHPKSRTKCQISNWQAPILQSGFPGQNGNDSITTRP